MQEMTIKQRNYLIKLGANESELDGLDIKGAGLLIGRLLKKQKEASNSVKNADKTPIKKAQEMREKLFYFEEFKNEFYEEHYSYYNEKEFEKTHRYTTKIDGFYLCLDTPRIETKFCFADDYDTPDNPISSNMCRHAETNQSYFISENLKQIERKIEYYSDTRKEFVLRKNYTYSNKIVYLEEVYILGCVEDSKKELKNIYEKYSDRELSKNEFEAILTPEARQHLIKCLNQIKEDFIKRLNTYLKRYGLSKIETWTYWANR